MASSDGTQARRRSMAAGAAMVSGVVGLGVCLAGSAQGASFTVSTETELATAISTANSNGDSSNTINVAADISLTSPLPVLNTASGKLLTISGGGNVIDGQNAQRIFFANTGNVVIENVTLANGFAKGGDGGTSTQSGGGGLGAGGALFVRGDLGGNSGANVTLRGVQFADNS